jgi:hypothetical protein
MAGEGRPRGLKPGEFMDVYAALKRRTYTFVLTSAPSTFCADLLETPS